MFLEMHDAIYLHMYNVFAIWPVTRWGKHNISLILSITTMHCINMLCWTSALPQNGKYSCRSLNNLLHLPHKNNQTVGISCTSWVNPIFHMLLYILFLFSSFVFGVFKDMQHILAFSQRKVLFCQNDALLLLLRNICILMHRSWGEVEQKYQRTNKDWSRRGKV